MPGSPPPAGPFVYQLRVVLRGVSPLIWRRLLVRSDTSIADLHTTLQLALGWSDEHLNRLVIHGRDYGVAARVVSGSGTTRMRSSLPISACASANGSSTSTTSSTAGATTYGWKRSCRSGGVGATRSAPAAVAPPRRRDAAGRGSSRSSASPRRSGSSSCWRRSSRPTPTNAAGSSAVAAGSSKSCVAGCGSIASTGGPPTDDWLQGMVDRARSPA